MQHYPQEACYKLFTDLFSCQHTLGVIGVGVAPADTVSPPSDRR